jgi:hypothetical protein
MIGEENTIFYWIYGILGTIIVIALIKLRQKDSLIITTNEFQQFQLHYLVGFISLIFAEVLCISTFYPILVQLKLSMDEITDLYIVSICSIAFFNVLLEIIDLGSRRGKCVLSTVLFLIATLTLFSNNFEILLLGRIFYGGGSVLLHTAFDAFLIHEHSTKGFPDDWLLNTFGKLSHSMSIAALFSGLTSLFFDFDIFLLPRSHWSKCQCSLWSSWMHVSELSDLFLWKYFHSCCLVERCLCKSIYGEWLRTNRWPNGKVSVWALNSNSFLSDLYGAILKC